MKTLKSIVISLIFLFVIPSTAFAADIIREENGSECIDLEAVYEQINDESKALTGQSNSVDAVKKAQTVATLTNIISILIGNQVYCVKDESVVSSTTTLKDTGILGQISDANSQMFSYFPEVNVADHLAQEFLPGYGTNNSLFAQTDTSWGYTSTDYQYAGSTDTDEESDLSYEDAARQDSKGFNFESQIENPVTDLIIGDVDEQLDEIESLEDDIQNSTEEASEVTLSGYRYLQESLHLDAIWKIFRNIAYLFFIIIMIITGFMIMFRKNLPSQVVVSVGNTLPQIILGILLVTFSFSISGVVMDIGKFSMNVIDTVFVQAYDEVGSDFGGEQEVEDTVTVGSISKLTNQVVSTVKEDNEIFANSLRKIPIIGNFLGGLASTSAKTIYSIAGQTYLLTRIAASLDDVSNESLNMDSGVPGADLALDVVTFLGKLTLDSKLVIAAKIGLIPFLLRNILILLVALYASFKLFLTMITTYLKLFVNIIFAPIQIAIGSLPGNFNMIGKWFRSLLANVLVFVGIHLVIHLFSFIGGLVDETQFNFFGNNGVFWPNFIFSLEGVILIGGYLFASSMPTIINGMLKVESSKELSAVGQSVKQAASKIPLVGGMFS